MKTNFPDTKGPWMSLADGWFNVLPPCSLQYTCSGFRYQHVELNDRPLITKPDRVRHKVQTEVLQRLRWASPSLSSSKRFPRGRLEFPLVVPPRSLVVPLRFLLRRLFSKFVGAKMFLIFGGIRVGRNSKALCESRAKSCSAGLGSIS